MTRKSKTISVEKIVKSVNSVLASSLHSREFRFGQMMLVENILHSTGNWRGYRFLLQSEVPSGELPGMVVNGTVENTPIDIRFAPGQIDTTRIQYFI